MTLYVYNVRVAETGGLYKTHVRLDELAEFTGLPLEGLGERLEEGPIEVEMDFCGGAAHLCIVHKNILIP